MYRGSLFWNELIPRILTVLREPGEPLATTVTPGTVASRRCRTLAPVWRSIDSTLTLDTAPVMSPRRCSVYAVTTTSSRNATGSILTLIVPRPAMGVSKARWPTTVKLRTASGGALMEYRPFRFVNARISVPCTLTRTPETGAPAAAATTPVPVRGGCWAGAVTLKVSANRTLIPSVRAFCARPFRNEGVSDCIFSIAILRVVNMACSSSGSTHGLQAMHCNQLAVRDQLDIAGREGLPETR